MRKITLKSTEQIKVSESSSLFSVTVINPTIKAQLRRKGLIWLTQSVIEGSEDRNLEAGSATETVKECLCCPSLVQLALLYNPTKPIQK